MFFFFNHIILREIYFVGLFTINSLIENLFNDNFTQVLNTFCYGWFIFQIYLVADGIMLILVLRRHLYGVM